MELTEGESELVLDALADYERTCAAADSVASSGYTQWVTKLRERLLAAHRERYRDGRAPTLEETLATAYGNARAAGRKMAEDRMVTAAVAHGLMRGMADAHAELGKDEQDEEPEEDPGRTCASESAEGTRCELSMLPGAHGSGRAGEPCHRGFNRGGVEVTWAAGNRQHERPLRPGDVICRTCGKRLRPRGLLGGPFVSREPGGVSERCGGTDELHVPVRPEEWETTLPTAPTDDELPEAADAVPANLVALLDGAPLRDVVRRLSVVRAAPSWTDGWSVAVRVGLHGLVPSDDEEQAVVLTMRATKGYLDARLEAELPKATPRWARTQPEAWGAEVARETGRRLRGDLPAREALLALEAAGHELQRERDRAAAELDRSQG